jgi:hypothetical protein
MPAAVKKATTKNDGISELDTDINNSLTQLIYTLFSKIGRNPIKQLF